MEYFCGGDGVGWGRLAVNANSRMYQMATLVLHSNQIRYRAFQHPAPVKTNDAEQEQVRMQERGKGSRKDTRICSSSENGYPQESNGENVWSKKVSGGQG